MSDNPYTEGYYENGEGSHYQGYEDWPQFKERAEWIKKTYNPKTVLEIGAAKGFMVKHLQQLGIKAEGIDISEYASAESGGSVRCFDMTIGMLDLIRYELVVSFDFMEHIKEEDLPMLFATLRTARQQFHMITTSEYDFGGDHTHYTSKPKQWWIDKFEEYGIKNYRIIHAGEQEETFV